MNGLLAAGLGLVFLAIVLAIAATGVFAETTPKSGVARSLAAVEAIHRQRRDLRERDLDRPFTERVLDPLTQRFTAIGRRFTPEERIAALACGSSLLTVVRVSSSTFVSSYQLAG